MNALDPANPYGTFFPARSGDYQLRRLPGDFLILRDGLPIVAIENRGENLVPFVGLTSEERRSVLSLLPGIIDLAGGVKRVRVLTWDGRPVCGSEIEADLARIGFVREDQEMIYYRRY